MSLAAAPLPDTAEKRSVSRNRVLLVGKLVYGGTAFTPECAIRNITDRGASVRLSPGLQLPPSVSLIETGSGRAYQADVVWQRSGFAGLAFTSVRDLSTSGPGDPLRRLWIDLLPREKR
jgi:hypothetical protein